MRTKRLCWARYRIPFCQPFATSQGKEAVRHGFLLRLVTDEGLVGLGEVAPIPGSSRRVRVDAATLLETLSQRLQGNSLEAVDDALGGVEQLHPAAVASVRCGLDTAVCDVLSQAAGLPVAQWLHGKASEDVPVNATVALPDSESAAEAAARAKARGFLCVKLKVGLAKGVEPERERVAAVRNAIGDRLKLRLDANGAWDVERAVTTLRALEPYGLEYVEQPVPSGNIHMMRKVREGIGTPIAADEDVASAEAAEHLLSAAAAEVLVIKPMVVGGLTTARRIIEAAQSRGTACVITTTIDTGIGVAAALHLAATLPEPVLACGLATADLLTNDLLASPLAVRGGRMAVPDTPGLGVRLNQKALKGRSHLS